MPPRRYTPRDIKIPTGERYSPFEKYGQMSISPESFDYEELQKKYPTKRISPYTPSFIQEQVDEVDVIRKSREADLAKKQAGLQLMAFEQDYQKQIASEIPRARQAIMSLNPDDEDYLEQLIALQSEFQFAFESPEFRSTVVEPMIRRHNMLQENRLILGRRQQQAQEDAPVNMREFDEAVAIARNQEFIEAAKGGDEIARFRLEEANRTIERAMRRSPSMSPTPTPPPMQMPIQSPQQFTPIQGTGGFASPTPTPSSTQGIGTGNKQLPPLTEFLKNLK